jgi:hypothetical protein
MNMKLKTLVGILAFSAVVWSGSPVLATEMAHHDFYCRCGERNAEACIRSTSGTCAAADSRLPRWNHPKVSSDDWPADMLLD